jgi:GT2 family glycosyltransferase
MADTLSIIVVAFNEERHIARLKRAMDALRRPPDLQLETVLMDGGSRDQTVPAATEAGFSQVLVRPGANIPRCRNEGAARAAGRWIAFLDADCEPAPDWLEQALPFLEANEAVIVGWPAEPPEPSTWVQRAWRLHWLHKNIHREEQFGRPVVRREGFRMITTRNMILARSVWERVYGFDEELATGEDTDFVFRAYLEGIPALGLPGLRVRHHGEPATLRAFFRQQLWHANRRSYRRIMQKTGGRIGGHAPLFTALYLATLLLAAAGLIGAIGQGPAWLLLVLPWLGLIAGPALVLGRRARAWRSFPALCLIYAAYGLARALNLAGLYQRKPSWKSPPAASTG